MKAQPKSAAPVSREVVEVVKRKMAAPSRPPPEGMTLNFKAPKNVSSSSSSAKREFSSNRKYDEYDNPYDGEYNSDEYAEEDDYYSEGSGNGEHRYDYDDNLPYDERTSRNVSRSYNDNMDMQNRERIKENRSSDTNVYAQSKQYSAGGINTQSSSTADAKENANKQKQSDSKLSSGTSQSLAPSTNNNSIVTSVVKTEVPSGPPSFVVSQYLQAARTSAQFFNYQPVLRATYRELKQYATSPCLPGLTTRCYIERNRSGTKRLAPYYSVCADLDGTYIIYMLFL